jgi:MerR family transcriptional regulator, light-induced transcriptional regulator
MEKNILFKSFLSGLLNCNKNYCHSLIIDAVNKGVDVQEIYGSIFYPAMIHIGELWQENKITVAQEHLTTAIVQSIICSLYNKVFDNKTAENKGKIMLTCASNELHELGSRMLSDLLEMEGFDVKFLGAYMPNYSVLEMIEKESPLIVGISCTMSFNINYVKELILKLKGSSERKIPIVVGGRAFDIDRELVEYVGADYYAKEFEESLELFNKLSLQTRTMKS